MLQVWYIKFAELDRLQCAEYLLLWSLRIKFVSKNPHCIFSPAVGSHVFDASGWQLGELWGTSPFKKLKILQIVAANANSMVMSQVTMSLYLVYRTELQGNGLLQFFKMPSFPNQFMENTWFCNQNKISFPKLFCVAGT